MKQKLPEYELPRFIGRDELTAEEFTSIIHNMLKRLMFVATFILAFVSVSHAQQNGPTDSVYTFRFTYGSDMFYVPTFGNDKELARLEECIGTYRPEIHSGLVPLCVDGYCNSAKTESRNLAVAKIRSNRVKSELIVRDGLREEHFTTRNHAGQGDFVTVRIIIPKDGIRSTSRGKDKETQTETVVSEVKECKQEVTRQEEPPTAQATLPEENVPFTENKRPTYGTETTELAPVNDPFFSIRANLLRWATLTPDLGIEWRINKDWSLLVNGSWTSWSWNNKDRRYALWEVAPEVRYYIGGKEKRGYLGAMYKAGSFNYKFSETGKQGDLMGGGITGGYVLRLNKAWNLDFSLGVGYLHADYEKYTVIDGVRVRRGKEAKNWLGPINAGVTLVWTIF